MKTICLILILIMCLMGCTAKSFLPEEAVIIEKIDQVTIFELRGKLFLFIFNDFRSTFAVTEISSWELKGEDK